MVGWIISSNGYKRDAEHHVILASGHVGEPLDHFVKWDCGRSPYRHAFESESDLPETVFVV